MIAVYRSSSLLLCGCLIATSLAAQTRPERKAVATPRQPPTVADEMTNADVVKMVKAGLGDAIVIATLRGPKKTKFDLSPDALIGLKAAGVGDAVLAVMLDPASAPAVAAAPALPPAPTPDPADPASPRESGIYIDKGTGRPELVLLEPTAFKGGKSGGWLGSAMTMGIKKMKWKAVVQSKSAANRSKNPQPVFFFYFDAKGSSLSYGSTGASNPTQFVLARMSPSDKGRELVMGEFGALGASSGTREKDTVEFTSVKIAPGIYRVQPQAPIAPGEYCFFRAEGSASMGAVTGNLFDFGIDG